MVIILDTKSINTLTSTSVGCVAIAIVQLRAQILVACTHTQIRCDIFKKLIRKWVLFYSPKIPVRTGSAKKVDLPAKVPFI